MAPDIQEGGAVNTERKVPFFESKVNLSYGRKEKELSKQSTIISCNSEPTVLFSSVDSIDAIKWRNFGEFHA